MGKGIAKVNLCEDNTGTLMQYTVEFKVLSGFS